MERGVEGRQTLYSFFPACGSARTSFPGIVHGGIVSTFIDDTAYWTLFQNFRLLAVTTEMNVKYLSPCPDSAIVAGKGQITGATDSPSPGDKIEVSVELFNQQSGKPLAKGVVKFFVLPKEHIPKIMGPSANELLNKQKKKKNDIYVLQGFILPVQQFIKCRKQGKYLPRGCCSCYCLD